MLPPDAEHTSLALGNTVTGSKGDWRMRHGHWPVFLTAIPALIHLYRLARILGSRFDYPMDIEWMEGGELLHAYRFLHGLDVYAEPGKGFMSYPYPPGHWFLLGLVGAVFGLDYPVGRLLSWAAIGCAAALLAREVYRQFSSTEAASVWSVLALGSIAAAFPVTGGWYDLIRNDSLAIALPIAAAVAVEPRELDRRRFLLAAGLMTAAIFTKQTGALFVLWLLLFQSLTHPRRGFALAMGAGGACSVLLALLMWRTHGNFWYYTFGQLRKHHVVEGRFGIALESLFEFAPYLVMLPVVFGILAWFGLLSRRTLLWSGMLLAALPASLLPFAKLGGSDNNLIPVAILVGPVALLMLGDLLRLNNDGTGTSKALLVVASAGCAFYLNARLYPLERYCVGRERRAAAVSLNQYVEHLEGGVLIPHFPFLATRNGQHTEQVHAMSWYDSVLAGAPGLSLRPFVQKTRPKYVIFSGLEWSILQEAVAPDYVLEGRMPLETVRAETMTPTSTGPTLILRRRTRPTGAECFEFESYSGWNADGVFARGPTAKHHPNQGIVIGANGYFANSFDPSSADAAVGRLSSPTFPIEQDRISLLVGGGSGRGTRVELQVDGQVVYTATGARIEVLGLVIWDVERFRGKLARLEIVDEGRGPWAHILVDSVCRYEQSAQKE